MNTNLNDNKKRRIGVLVLLVMIILLFILVGCGTNAMSYPASRVYLQGGSDTPKPTDTPPPGFFYCNMPCPVPTGGPGSKLKPMPFPTPYPSPTPYIQKYVFWRTQRVNINGLVLEFVGAINYGYFERNYQVMYFKVWNYTGDPIVVTYPLAGKVREMRYGGGMKVGQWDAGEFGQDFVYMWMVDKFKSKYWHDFAEPKDITIPVTKNPKDAIMMPVIIEAPAGRTQRFILQTDPLSNDPESFIIFYNDLPPMRCDGARAKIPAGQGKPMCKYHAEIKPNHYFLIQDLPKASYYIENPENGASSYNYYQTAPYAKSAPGSAKFTAMVKYQGPTTQIMPLDKMSITQHYGCTGFQAGQNYANSHPDVKSTDCVYNYILSVCEWPGEPQCTVKGSKGKEWAWGFHMGLDLQAPEGTYIYSVTDGDVISAGDTMTSYGILTIIKSYVSGDSNYDQYCFYYAHQSALWEGLAGTVKAGQGIGLSGGTGGWAAHLHFEIRPVANGGCGSAGGPANYINPMGYLGLMP